VRLMEISKWEVHVETERGAFERRHCEPGLVSASVVLPGLDSRPPHEGFVELPERSGDTLTPDSEPLRTARGGGRPSGSEGDFGSRRFVRH
jgi:hypothetical protein